GGEAHRPLYLIQVMLAQGECSHNASRPSRNLLQSPGEALFMRTSSRHSTYFEYPHRHVSSLHRKVTFLVALATLLLALLTPAVYGQSKQELVVYTYDSFVSWG